MDAGYPPEFFRAAVESSTVAFVVLDHDGVIRYHTGEAARLLERAGAELLGRRLAGMLEDDESAAAEAYVRRIAALDPGRSVFFAARCVLSDGDDRWIEFTGVNLLQHPDVRGLVVNLADRTEQHRLATEATTDPLTGLANRRAVMRRLERHEGDVLMFVDIDYFKAINDIHGHAFGDQVLVVVARRLQNVFGVTALIGRMGGDEFVVILPQSAVERAWPLAEKALAAIRVPIGENALRLTASIGITENQRGDADAATARADTALYRAKATGRGRICAPADEEPVWAERRRANPSALEDALRQEAQLKSQIAQLTEVSRRDDRTGLLNDDAYKADVVAIDTLARQDGRGYALALCDIDYFGKYNNMYSYDAGNGVLKAVAGALHSACRPGDLVYRWGGEELVVVLQDADVADASALAERLRVAVEELDIRHDNRPAPNCVTISVGVAALDADRHQSAQDLFNEANRHLRHAKDAGRNRVNPPAPQSLS